MTIYKRARRLFVALPLITIALLSTACLSDAQPSDATLTAIFASTPSPTPLAITILDDSVEGGFEVEVYQGAVFESKAAYDSVLADWNARRPPQPQLSSFTTGAGVGVRTLNDLNQMADVLNDKWKHCVWGAEIALSTDVQTATYHAWLKESRDLTDGNSTTNFDELDYEASVDGATQAVESAGEKDFMTMCEARWGSKSQSWNGNAPNEGS